MNMRQHEGRKPCVSPFVPCSLLVVSSWSARGFLGSAGGPEVFSGRSFWFPGALLWSRVSS